MKNEILKGSDDSKDQTNQTKETDNDEKLTDSSNLQMRMKHVKNS